MNFFLDVCFIVFRSDAYTTDEMVCSDFAINLMNLNYFNVVCVTGIKFDSKRSSDHLAELPTVSATSPAAINGVEEHREIDINDLFGSGTPEDDNDIEERDNVEEKDNVGFDMNVPLTDDEIADVDDSGDEVDKGPNAAEALRAHMNAEGREEQTSTSSSSSGSGSSSASGSGSSSSSDSDGSDEDSVNSI